MLHVFFGSDRTAVKDAADAFMASYRDTHTVTLIDALSFIPGQLIDHLEATSLFGEQFLFLIDTPSANDVMLEELHDNLKSFGGATHQFVVLEHSLLAPQKKQYAKVATTLEEFTATSKERFNTFALADALASRDRRRLWLLYSEAKQVAIADEELIGILWWQLKAMRLAALTSSAEEAGMKPFPYNKAKQALKQFPLTAVEETARNLLTVYHDGHGGRRDMRLALEQLMLKI